MSHFKKKKLNDGNITNFNSNDIEELKSLFHRNEK